MTRDGAITTRRRHFEVGRGWHKLRFWTGVNRWPTVRGENPPMGLPYRCIEASYGSRCVQIRLWNWRRR